MSDLSRRQFLRHSCCAAVGATGMLSALGQLRMMGAVAADGLPGRAAATPADYKALVCLFLNGGNDGTSMILPTDAASYAAYAAARADLAIPQATALPISAKTYSDGRSYGFHPSGAGLQGLFNQGKVAVLANVGTLLRPTTLAEYKTGKNLPPQLFSHIDQLMHWQSGVPDRPFETGWGGRLADLVEAMNGNHQISMSITLNGSNSFQRGRVVNQYAVGSTLPTNIVYSKGVPPAGVVPVRRDAMKALMANQHPNALAAAFGSVAASSIADAEVLGAALAAGPTIRTVFPATETAARLSMIARIISIASTLGLKRQIFFVQLGGWDLHGTQATAYGPLLAEISNAMKAFYDATVELGVANQVTTFTASDFGRTYVPNAGGTDHGWGNQQLIMGGGVKGGEIYGRMPSLTVGGEDDTGRGRWIPSTSVDEYNATLATWFGVSAANLSTVLPNIGRFSRPNLGFLS